MTFQQAIQSGFEQYAKFEGRDGRSAFWYWVLFSALAGTAASILDAIIGTDGIGVRGGLLGNLTTLALFLPGLSVGCRRLHDIGKSGWWQLVALVPLLGWVYVLYLFLQPSDAGANQYGPPPVSVRATA